LAGAWLTNTDIRLLKTNLNSYQGVKRRFDYQIRSEQIIFIDDYAHHPAEIKACIESVRHLYPKKSITVAFQPHLYSRTNDFANEFAKSLELSDKVVLTDIYPAREEPIQGVDSNLIFKKIKNKNKILSSYNNLAQTIIDTDTDIVITMGAGDIDRLVPEIKRGLIKKFSVEC
jgi:UDP-N-acetylmuramate--alanine ligase